MSNDFQKFLGGFKIFRPKIREKNNKKFGATQNKQLKITKKFKTKGYPLFSKITPK